MNENNESTISSNYNYHLKGLARFGGCLLTGFIIWCALHYPMSETMQGWFFAWAILTWITC